jgi:hypothetical protein
MGDPDLQYYPVELAAFPGVELVAAYDDPEQRLWLPVATVCSMLGLDPRHQRQRVERDYAEHVEKFTLPTSGGPQELVRLEYEALGLWLATVQAGKTSTPVKAALKKFRAQVMAAASDILQGKLHPVTFDERRKSARAGGNSLLLEYHNRLAALERAIFVGEDPRDDAGGGVGGRLHLGRCPRCQAQLEAAISPDGIALSIIE